MFLSDIFSPDRSWSDVGRPLLVVFHVLCVHGDSVWLLYLVCRALRRSVKNSNLFSVLCIPKISHISSEKIASFWLMISADFDKSASDLTMQSCVWFGEGLLVCYTNIFLKKLNLLWRNLSIYSCLQLLIFAEENFIICFGSVLAIVWTFSIIIKDVFLECKIRFGRGRTLIDAWIVLV